eukprot:TRINITY_DN3323_c2_g1_i1.p1 TRINITY_DN3323_c2_g1~~TRINITY_DN3323_c2_g1_i1.p1  ORF type:complete len:761 (+),score=48.54 TRINITY_DN3323_c2_g1_i1:59-2284(+)
MQDVVIPAMTVECSLDSHASEIDATVELGLSSPSSPRTNAMDMLEGSKHMSWKAPKRTEVSKKNETIKIKDNSEAALAQERPAMFRFKNVVLRQTQKNRVLKLMGGENIVKRANQGFFERIFGEVSVDTIDVTLLLISFTIHIINGLIIPYRLSMNFEGSKGWMVLELTLDIIQVLLLLISFVKPYEQMGMRVTQTRITSQHYFNNGFFQECVCMLPTSFLCWFVFSGNPFVRLFKLYPFGVQFVIEKLSASPYVCRMLSPYGVHAATQVVVCMWLVHLTSCMWYYALKHDAEFPPDRVPLAASTDDVFAQFDTFTMYLKGVEWSLKHMVGFGVTCKFPVTDYQVIFMLVVAMMGLCVYTTLLASVSSFVMHVADQNPRERLRLKLDEVTTCLKRHKLPQDFRTEVRAYYRHVFKVSGRIGTNNILNDLPPSLLSQVNHHVGLDLLSKMPMFKGIESKQIVMDLKTSLVPKVFLPGLEIVSIGQRCSEMMFVWSGELSVVDETGNTVRILKPGDNYGEVALMAEVKRLTAVVTNECSTVFLLTRQSFQAAIHRHEDLAKHFENFEKRLVRRIEHRTSLGENVIESLDEEFCVRTSDRYTTCSSGSTEDSVSEFMSTRNGEQVGAFLFSPSSPSISIDSDGDRSSSRSSSRSGKGSSCSVYRFSSSRTTLHHSSTHRQLPLQSKYPARHSSAASTGSVERLADESNNSNSTFLTPVRQSSLFIEPVTPRASLPSRRLKSEVS